MVECLAGIANACFTSRGRNRKHFPPGVLQWVDEEHMVFKEADEAKDEEFGPSLSVSRLLKELPREDGDSWLVLERWADANAVGVKQFWTADAWAEALPDVSSFVTTVLFEILPPPFGAFACCCIEGKAAAKNRLLMPSSISGKSNAARIAPAEVDYLQLILPALVLIHRAMSLGVKYAYFAPSEMELIKSSTLWLKTRNEGRKLGVHKFYGAVGIGSLQNDFMEQMFASAIRNNIAEEVRHCYMQVAPFVAKEVWRYMSPILDHTTTRRQTTKNNDADAALFITRYGDAAALLGLSKSDHLEAEVQQGRLRVSLLALYFLNKCRKPIPKQFASAIALVALAYSFVHPVVLWTTGKPAWGTSTASTFIYILRVFAVFSGSFPCFLFFTYPALDSFARLRMSYTMLASFECGEAQAHQLMRGFSPLPMPINSHSDLQAFWILSRLLGPTFDIGTSTRYSSGFVLIQVSLIVVATSVLRLRSTIDNDVEWGVVVELMILFALGAAAVFSSSLICMRLNLHAAYFMQVGRLAGLARPQLGAIAKDVCADIRVERMIAHPVKIMYMPADAKLVSFLWSGLLLLSAVFAGSLPGVDIPLFPR